MQFNLSNFLRFRYAFFLLKHYSLINEYGFKLPNKQKLIDIQLKNYRFLTGLTLTTTYQHSHRTLSKHWAAPLEELRRCFYMT